MANLVVYGVSWGTETEYVAIFSRRPVCNASLHYPMSIMATDPACPRAMFPMRVTLFPSGMLCVTNIPFINGNDTLYCSDLNGEHAGESFKSQDLLFLRYADVNMNNCPFYKK